MTSVRQPAVADMFYPGNPEKLRTMVREFLALSPLSQDAPKALIVPHAGYVYSGPVAGSAYARLKPLRERIERVLLLGPAHRVPLRGLALPAETALASPLGEVPIDAQAVEVLKTLPQVRVDSLPHSLEHSLEVHLPFLQESLASFALVPLVVGDAEPEKVAELLALLWGGEETLIVVSSDLSHYHDYETARRIDGRTSSAIEELRIDDLRPELACGCIPIQGLLLEASRRHLNVVNVDLRNSGDTAGSRDKVVGYGAYVLF